MRARALPYEVDGIRYAVCQAEDVGALVPLLARAFAGHDPPAVALGLTVEDFVPYMAAVTAGRVSVGLTIVARDLASGNLAGGLAAEDAALPAQLDPRILSPKFAPMYELIGDMDATITDPVPIEPGSVLHVFMLGVAEPFARRGIAQCLVDACLANAAALGYRVAVTEATNLVSQHIFAKRGFVTRAEASYADYRRDGTATFGSIADQGGVKSMLLQPLGVRPGPSAAATPRRSDRA
jgi:ribosomal protein S18 acetylase RimI-like enzyme